MPPGPSVWRGCRALATRWQPLSRQQLQQPRIACLARGFADGPTNSSNAIQSNASSASTTANLAPSTPSSGPAGLSSSEIPMMKEEFFELEQTQTVDPNEANRAALYQLEMLSQGLNPFSVEEDGHKFGLPDVPKAKAQHKDRYEPFISQLTRLIMRDGKLAKAQRDMAHMLNYLRTSDVPTLDPTRPLIPGAPPPSHLPLDPVRYLEVAIDSVAPLLRVRHVSGIAGGGASLAMPAPLGLRQRRRQAFLWIMAAVDKRPSKGSGDKQFPTRLGEEIVAIVEGKSKVWETRQLLHKLATTSRANLNHMNTKPRNKK